MLGLLPDGAGFYYVMEVELADQAAPKPNNVGAEVTRLASSQSKNPKRRSEPPPRTRKFQA